MCRLMPCRTGRNSCKIYQAAAVARESQDPAQVMVFHPADQQTSEERTPAIPTALHFTRR